MNISCRPLEEIDIPVICGLPQSEDELYFLAPKATFPLTPAQLKEIISKRVEPTVAELDGEVVAFANFYRWGKEACSVGNVIVASAARGKGVGRYLIQQMIDISLAKYEAAEVTVSCFNQNIAGLLFYPKLGFEPYAIEERQDKRGNAVALVHMRIMRPAT